MIQQVQSYGFTFNDITVDDNVVTKTYKNEKGRNKINKEAAFYQYIQENTIPFRMPDVINHCDGVLKIKYIQNTKTLLEYINEDNLDTTIENVMSSLKRMHKYTHEIKKETFLSDINQELGSKVLDRYNETKWNTIPSYNKIVTVNDVKINKNIHYYIDKIKNEITDIIKKEYVTPVYSIVHGDTHLNNILIDKNENLYFIDPRGYFGKTNIHGLKEYDYAKFLFGLSGYSYFDMYNIDELEIVDGNLNIRFIDTFIGVYQKSIFNRLTILLSLSIWLGNNGTFENKNKSVASLMIAFYMCEMIL